MAPYPRIGTVGLGRQQRDLLVTLDERGSWADGCGWSVAGPVRTMALLGALEKRTLVARYGDVWRLTARGKKAAMRELGRRVRDVLEEHFVEEDA